MPTYRVENSAQVLSCWLNFAHILTLTLLASDVLVLAVLPMSQQINYQHIIEMNKESGVYLLDWTSCPEQIKFITEGILELMQTLQMFTKDIKTEVFTKIIKNAELEGLGREM